MRVARMAELAKMPTTVHISGGFGFVYMLHFATVVRRHRQVSGIQAGHGTVRKLVRSAHHGKEREDVVPTGPGVGIKDVRGLLQGTQQV